MKRASNLLALFYDLNKMLYGRINITKQCKMMILIVGKIG